MSEHRITIRLLFSRRERSECAQVPMTRFKKNSISVISLFDMSRSFTSATGTCMEVLKLPI